MEPAIPEVPGPRILRGFAFLQQPFHLQDIGVGRPERGQAGKLRFDQYPRLQHLGRARLRSDHGKRGRWIEGTIAHEGAASHVAPDPPLGFQHIESFAQRAAAEIEILCQLALGRQPAVQGKAAAREQRVEFLDGLVLPAHADTNSDWSQK